MTPSPPSPAHDGHFPQGQCRYILMVPELKGQRCGCACFTHNKAVPGASCECGHLACFHLTSAETPASGQNRDEMEVMRQRIKVLEQQAGMWAEYGGLDNITSRLSQLEETVDKNRDDIHTDIKSSYRNITAAWQLVEQMRKKIADLEDAQRFQSEQMAKSGYEIQELKNRHLELLDSDECLEERIEKLESADSLSSPVREPPRVSHLTAPPRLARASPRIVPSSSLSSPASRAPTWHHERKAQPEDAMRPRTGSLDPATAWTVHVSLLPSADQPFPFEKDTNAYKRCLSRGLQRMVAVEGADARSFTTAISRAFRHVFQGRAWEALQAKICHAQNLEGLPMLRRLEPEAAHQDYNKDFLQQRCAVCDASGRIDSLYVALEEGTLTWEFIRRLPVYVEGLEASWEYDKLLDQQDSQESELKPRTQAEAEAEAGAEPGTEAESNPNGRDAACNTAAEDVCNTPQRSLKRGAAMISQTSTLATGGVSSSDSVCEGPRAKMARSRMPDMVEV